MGTAGTELIRQVDRLSAVRRDLLHDVGAFQIGIGLGLLAALVWSDAKSVALLGFVVAGVIHTANHTIDLDLGGHTADIWFIGASTVLAAQRSSFASAPSGTAGQGEGGEAHRGRSLQETT